MALGGIGVISTMANVIPAETAEICRLWTAGDPTAAASMQIRCQPLIEALFHEVNPIPVKAALKKLKRIQGSVRLPLVEPGKNCDMMLTQALKSFALL